MTLCKKISVLLFSLLFFAVPVVQVQALTVTNDSCEPICNNITFENFSGELAIDGSGNFYIFDIAAPTARIFKLSAANERVAIFDGNNNGHSAFLFNSVTDLLANGTDLYILNGANNRIELFDTDGNFVKYIGEGNLSAPRSMDLYNNKLYVLDGNVGVKVFDLSNDTLVGTYGSIGTGAEQFTAPAQSEVALDTFGNIYVLNYSATYPKVLKMDNSGTFITEWGTTPGTNAGELYYPSGLAIDASDNVYTGTTSTYGSYNVQKFDSSGNFVSWMVPYGLTNGQTSSSSEILFNNNKLYVSDPTWDSFEVFSTDGTYLDKIGPIAGSDSDEFGHITDIYLDDSENVYITEDYPNSRMKKYDSDFNLLLTVGSNGTGDGKFTGVGAVTVDSQGQIILTDQAGRNVQVFDSSGTFQYKFGSSGSGNGQFGGLLPGVAVDSSDNIYVADTYNMRVQKFSNDGTYISQISTDCSDVAVATNGNIYVLDPDFPQVNVFNSSGTSINTWGAYGSGTSQFDIDYDLSSISLDVYGNVYVSDSYNHRFQAFDSSGTFLTQWGQSGYGQGKFYRTNAVAVTSAGLIYAADYYAGTVQKLNLAAFITSLDSGLGTEDINGVDLATGGSGGFGPSKVVRLTDGNSHYISEISTDLTDDRDWSGVTGEVDVTTGKSVVNGLTAAAGTGSTHSLYIPIPSGSTSTSFVLCPDATTIADVSTTCTNAVTFTEGQTQTVGSDSVTASKVALGGLYYWKAAGVSGTGGVSIYESSGGGDNGGDTGGDQSNNTGGSTSSSDSSNSTPVHPSCTNAKPSSTPDLFQINSVGTSKATLYFTPSSGNTDRYMISYSTHQGGDEYGFEFLSNSNGVVSVDIGYLDQNTTYYFKVRAGNGCMPGDWSNQLSIKTGQKYPTYRWSAVKNIVSTYVKKIVSPTSINKVTQPNEEQETEKALQEERTTTKEVKPLKKANPSPTSTTMPQQQPASEKDKSEEATFWGTINNFFKSLF